MASSKPANEAHQPLAMCAVCWKNPLKPPFLHNPSAKHQPIPKRKDDLIKAINGNTGSGSLAGYTVRELRHLYSLKIGRKAHESCPLIGLASMHREEMAQLCKNHGVHLGEGKHTKAEYSLAIRRHWEEQCEMACAFNEGQKSVDSTANCCQPSDGDSWSVVGNDEVSPRRWMDWALRSSVGPITIQIHL